MGLTTEHRGRGPTVVVRGTGQFLNSTCIRTNQSRKSIIYIVLSSQKEFVDNVQEPLGSSDDNQLHFNINIKSDKTKVKQCRRDFRRGNYEEIGKSLALIDWPKSELCIFVAPPWGI